MEKKLGLEPAEVVEQARWAVGYAARPRRRGRVLVRGRHPLGPGLRRQGLPPAVEAGATTINLPDTVGYALRRSTRPSSLTCAALPRARGRRALGPLPRRPRPRGRELARRVEAGATRSSAPSTASASGPATRRSRRSSWRCDVRRSTRDRDRVDPAQIGRRPARRAADGLRRAAQQGDRRRERLRARGRHPPGRDAQGRGDVPDHGPGGARPRDDAAARQALRPARVRPGLPPTPASSSRARSSEAFARFKELADTGEQVSVDDVFEEVAVT